MKLSAEIDLILGILVGTGKRKLGFGFRIQRKKEVKRIGVDLGEKRVKRFRLFLLKNAEVKTWNWKSVKKNVVNSKRERAMKRANVFSLFLQMMPSSLHASTTPPEHWEFLEDIDAPQWADLAKESTLIGLQGDHPWFHARHSHHEMSLARVEAYPRDMTEVLEKPQQVMKKKVDIGKGTVAKLLKPPFKANTVKACLGGMQRISNVGSKDVRLSSRPRLTNQANQPRQRVSKKVRLSRSGSLRMGLPAKTAAGKPDPRSAVGGRELNARKDTNGAKQDKLRRMEPAVKGRKDQRITPGGVGRNGHKNEKIVPLGSPQMQSGKIERESELCDSPRSSALMYRLPSPPERRRSSSASDMAFSSGGSRKSSTSSRESRIPSPRTTTITRRKLLPEKSAKVVSSVPKKVVPQDLPVTPPSKVVMESREPSVDISAVPKLHQRVLKADRKNPSTAPAAPADRKQRSFSPRGKRRSIGPSLRLKPIEKVTSSSAKKKAAAAPAAVDPTAAVGKETGAQTTHPILERLRKSWGSALRMKQRQTEPQNATANSEDRQSPGVTLDRAEAYKEETLERNEAQDVLLQAVISGREKSGGAVVHFSDELMRRNSSGKSESIIPFEDVVDATKVQGSPAHRSGGVSNPGTARKVTASEGSGGNPSASPSHRLGLAKMHPNQQKIRPDGGSQFKKQYAFPETGVSTTLRANKENMEMRYKSSLSPPPSVRGSTSQNLGPRTITSRQARPAVSAGAGNHQAPGMSPQHQALRLSTQHQAPGMSPQHQALRLSTQNQALRLSTQNQAPRQSPQHQVARQSTQHQAPPRLSIQTRSSQQPGPLATSKTTNLPGRPARPTGSVESRTPSGQKSELADTKLSNKGSLRGIAAASKPSLQKGEASSSLAKEAILNSKGCKNGVRVADESAAIQSHRVKVAAKSEPTTHNVKSIREWEIKSGRRYHDLQPIERQQINQQITAASKALTKRPTA